MLHNPIIIYNGKVAQVPSLQSPMWPLENWIQSRGHLHSQTSALAEWRAKNMEIQDVFVNNHHLEPFLLEIPQQRKKVVATNTFTQVSSSFYMFVYMIFMCMTIWAHYYVWLCIIFYQRGLIYMCMTIWAHYYVWLCIIIYQRAFSLWANANGKFLNLPSQLHREHQSLQQFAVFLGGCAMLRGSFWESRRKKWTRPIYPFIHSFYPCALSSIHSLMQCWTFL